MASIERDAPLFCRCEQGWICEEHPDKPYPDDNCTGPGTQCDNPECPWWKGPSAAALRMDHSYIRPDKGTH